MMHDYGGSRRVVTIDASSSTACAVGVADITLPEVMALAQPNAKFVLLLRDPVERMHADYLHSVAKKKQTYSAKEFHKVSAPPPPRSRSRVCVAFFRSLMPPPPRPWWPSWRSSSGASR